eukprot:CAMPEP_0201560450 /NCGR_PEP_ID=MMETSP0173_2-20130828/78267_1 /ASSEMBLY_ACC=CAM_ASM_000268 /TAXON_ID=218659 /ORGANISM="Vexillifera sp., Strain DIVA3 564/2" /LENGTH=3877 /DNA_ID=CAMNT_0047974903 /DNA_START=61 /DNA_END=11694 /DNA_ORIENTATION=-
MALPHIDIPSSVPSALEYQDTYAFGRIDMSAAVGSGESAQSATTVSGIVSPCEADYWKIDAADWSGDYGAGDWINIQASVDNHYKGEDSDLLPPQIDEPVTVYIKWYPLTEGNPSVMDLPSKANHDWKITVSCNAYGCSGGSDDPDLAPVAPFEFFMELPPCQVHSYGQYWIAVAGPFEEQAGNDQFHGNPHAVEYSVTVARRKPLAPDCGSGFECGGASVESQTDPIRTLTLGETHHFGNDSNPYPDYFWPVNLDDDESPNDSWLIQNLVRQYRYFRVNVPRASLYSEGSYLTVNVSQVQSGNYGGSLDGNGAGITKVHFGTVPYAVPEDSLNQQTNPAGENPEGDICQWTNACLTPTPQNQWDAPSTKSNCECTPDTNYCQESESDEDQNTCNIVVSPCNFRYDIPLDDAATLADDGAYFIAIQVPFNDRDVDDDWEPLYTSYSIRVDLVQPYVEDLTALSFPIHWTEVANKNSHNWIYTKYEHYKVQVSEAQQPSESYLRARITVADGETALILSTRPAFDKDVPDYNLAGTIYNDDMCNDCYDATYSCTTCNTCQVTYKKCELQATTYYYTVEWQDSIGSDNLPYAYTLDFELFQDPLPVAIQAGVPVHASIEEGKHAFYSLSVNDIPHDAWLYVELFNNAQDSELILQLAKNTRPGQYCYPTGEFICRTQDGVSTNERTEHSQSCYFFVDTCRLEDSQYYLSVFGVDRNGEAVNSNYYGRDVQYTLWVDYEYPVEISNNVTYTDVVRSAHYNHYKISVPDVQQGSWFTVEVDNIQPLIEDGNTTPTINAYVNHGELAGQCPCYTSLFNCTGTLADSDCSLEEECTENWLEDNYNLDYVTTPTINAYVNHGELAGQCPCYTSLFNCTGTLNNSPCGVDECTENWLEDNYNLDYVKYGTPSTYLYNEDTYGCCKVEVDACSFRSGDWYIGVFGYNPTKSSWENNFLTQELPAYKQTPIGYTLTAIVHPAPPVWTLPTNTDLVDWVADQHHNHYRLQASYTEGSRLVVRVTFMQDECGRHNGEESNWGYQPDFLGSGDHLELRVNAGNLALQECYDAPWSCEAHRDSYSVCTLVIPDCQWAELTRNNQDLFVSVRGDFDDDNFRAQYTLRADIEEEAHHPLSWGQKMYGTLLADRYSHYWIDVDVSELLQRTVHVDTYYNFDRTYYQDVNDNTRKNVNNPQFAMWIDSEAGVARDECYECHNNAAYLCTNQYACHWEFEHCTLQQLGSGRWYFSLYSSQRDFYDLPVEYVLSISNEPSIKEIEAGTQNRFVDQSYALWIEDGIQGVYGVHGRGSVENKLPQINYHHYMYVVTEDPAGDEWLTFHVTNIAGGSLGVYYNFDAVAGTCPCYTNEFYISCDGEQSGCDGQDCSITIESCNHRVGTHYFSVVPHTFGDDQDDKRDNDDVVFEQPITWQVEVQVHRALEVITANPTNTNANGQVFRLGIDDDLEPWDVDEFEVINEWILWNEANTFNDQVGDNGDYIHYRVQYDGTTSDLFRVFAALDNVRSTECVWGSDNPISVSVDLFYSTGMISPSLPSGSCVTGCTSSQLVCDEVGPGQLCINEIEPCNNPEFYLTALVHSTQSYDSDNIPDHKEYDHGFNPVTFDLKIFLQDTFTLSEGEGNARNITHFPNAKLRFRLPSVTSSGLTPLTQVVFYDINGPFDVYLSPSSIGQAGDANCGSQILPNDNQAPEGACYHANECIEVRGGRPWRNSDFNFDSNSGQPDEDDPEPVAYRMNFDVQCGGTTQVGVNTFSVSQCTVNLLPCALRTASGDSEDWFLTVVPRTSSALYYRVYWEDNTSPTTLGGTISASFINNRLAYPDESADGSGDENADNLVSTEMDAFHLYQFEVPELDHTTYDPVNIGNGNLTLSIPAHDFVRLEVQIDTDRSLDTSDFVGDVWLEGAAMVWYVVRDDGSGLPPIGNLQTVGEQNAGWNIPGCDCEHTQFYCLNQDCNSNSNHMYISECCLQAGTYWVIGRQLDLGFRGTQVRVRLVSQDLAPTIINPDDINPDAVTPSSAFIASTEIATISRSSNGVEPGNYHHYVIPIYDEAFFHDESTTPATIQSLFLFLQATDPEEDGDLGECDGCGSLHLFARFGGLAGWSPSGNQAVSYEPNYGLTYGTDGKSDDDKTCLAWEFTCELSNTGNPDSYCSIQIPHCVMRVDNLYVSVYHDLWLSHPDNPSISDPDEQFYAFDHFRGYRMYSFFSKNSDITQTVSSSTSVSVLATEGVESAITGNPGVTGGSNGGYTVHYAFEVEESAFALDCGFDECMPTARFHMYVRNRDRDDADLPNAAISAVYLTTPQTLNDDHQNTYAGPHQLWNSAVNGCYDSKSIQIDTNIGVASTDPDDQPTGNNYYYETCPRDRRGVTIVPGWYYVSFVLTDDTEFEFTVDIIDQTEIDRSSSGWNRITSFSTLSETFQNEPNTVEVLSFGESGTSFETDDQEDWYYSWEITDADVANGLKYLQVNFTDIDNIGGIPDANTGNFYLEMWTDTCQRYDCNYPTATAYGGCHGPQNGYLFSDPTLDNPDDDEGRKPAFTRYIIDAQGLAPCSITPGRYFLHFHRAVASVEDNDDENALRRFNIQVLLREGTVETLNFGTPVPHTATIWRHQYQFYQVTTTAEHYAATGFDVHVDHVTCGTVEMWVKHGTIAGPKHPGETNGGAVNKFDLVNHRTQTTTERNGIRTSLPTCDRCSSAYCKTDAVDIDSTDVGSCSVTIDNCEIAESFDGSQFTSDWFFTVHGVTSEYEIGNVHATPVSYTIWVDSSGMDLFESQSVGCPHSLDYGSLETTCPPTDVESAEIEPQVFVFDVEVLPLASGLALEWSGDELYYSWNKPAAFLAPYDQDDKSDDSDQAKCTDQTRVTSSWQAINNVDNNNMPQSKQLFVTLYGNSGVSYVTLHRWERYIPNVIANVVYASSLAEGRNAAYGMYRPSQWYRIEPNLDYLSDPSWVFKATVHSVSGGSVEAYIAYQSEGNWNGVGTNSGFTWNSGLTIDEDDTPYVFGREACSCNRYPVMFVSFDDANQDCTCNPVVYEWSYTLSHPIDVLQEHVPVCDVVAEPDHNGLYGVHTYRLDPPASPDLEANRIENGIWTNTWLTVTLDDTNSFGLWGDDGFVDLQVVDWQEGSGSVPDFNFDDGCGHSSIATADCDKGIPSNVPSTPERVSSTRYCPYENLHMNVRSKKNHPYDDEFHYKLHAQYVEYEIEDITSAVASSAGFTRTWESCEGGDYYFSWQVDGTEFEFLEIVFDDTTHPMYYAYGRVPFNDCYDTSGTGRIDDFCQFSTNEGSVAYLHIELSDTTSPKTLRILRRNNNNDFDNEQLTLGELSARHTFDPSELHDHVWYFDVSEVPAVDDALVIDIENVENFDYGATLQLSYGGIAEPSGEWSTCDIMSRSVSLSSPVTHSSLVVNECLFTQAGRYYLTLRSHVPGACATTPQSLRVRPHIVSAGVPIVSLGHNTLTNQVVQFTSTNWSPLYYSIPRSSASGTALAEVRVANVQNGQLRLTVNKDSLNLVAHQGFQYDVIDVNQGIEGFGFGDGCNPYSCNTQGADLLGQLNNGCGSCTVFLGPCMYADADVLYAHVTPTSYDFGPVTFEITATEWEDHTVLSIDEATTQSFTNQPANPRNDYRIDVAKGNKQWFPYVIETNGATQSLVIQVTVEGTDSSSSYHPGDAVTLIVSDHPWDDECPCSDHTYKQTLVCEPQYADWVCEFEISTRADHPQTEQDFYVYAYGSSGTFSLNYSVGEDNCVDPSDSLSFCAGFVEHSVWSWSNLKQLDDEASCFYDHLYQLFYAPHTTCGREPCDLGVSHQCALALQNFACATSFRPCASRTGFTTSVCRSACNQVSEMCEHSLTTVDLGVFDCASAYYIDSGICSGHPDVYQSNMN